MTLFGHLPCQSFVFLDEAANHEKSGFHIEFIQQLQHAFGHAGNRTIIKGQCDQFLAPADLFDSSDGH